MKRGPEEQALDSRPSKRASIRARSSATQCGGSEATNAVLSRFKCVKRAAVRDGFDQKTSQRTGFVEVGECIDALERRTNNSGVIRVRCERGWLSCTSQKGDVLLQPVAIRPVGQGCRCCGKIGHLKAKCPHKDRQCSICGKAGHLRPMCTSSTVHIEASSSNTDRPKKKLATDAPPTLEDLDAEMDDYFEGREEAEQEVNRTMNIEADGKTTSSAVDAAMAASDAFPVDASPTISELDSDMGVYLEDTEQLLREAEELLRAAEEIEEV